MIVRGDSWRGLDCSGLEMARTVGAYFHDCCRVFPVSMIVAEYCRRGGVPLATVGVHWESSVVQSECDAGRQSETPARATL